MVFVFQEQYRAWYVPSPDQVFVFNSEAKEFEIQITSWGRGFRGVEKEDIAITVDECKQKSIKKSILYKSLFNLWGVWKYCS